MATLEERVMNDLKALMRLWPALQERLAWSIPPEGEAAPGGPLALQAGDEACAWPPSLEALLDHCAPLPTHSIILGACEDGLPFMLDLTNPAPGALLALADPGSGKTRLLKAILASAVYLNPQESVEFNLIAPDPGEFPGLAQVGQCRQVVHAGENSTEDLAKLIDDLALVVETRRRSTPGDPAIILAIDDLARCAQLLDEQAFAQLYALAKHGPRSRVWTIATLSAERSPEVDPRLLAAFRTRLIGVIEDAELGFYLSGDESQETRALQENGLFCVPYGGGWVRFWVCDPDSLA
ncbi:MAG: hypothetical protein JXA78_01190 [Anaerolineales bacterium]|nr:hypothetical protein [Anaerolineales bacterium]